MHRLLFSCFLFACAYAQNQSVDSTIAVIFNNTQAATSVTPVTTTSPPDRSSVEKPEKCTTEENQRGVCVLYFLCDTSGYIVTNGIGILDIHQRRRRRQTPADGGGEKPLNGLQQSTTGSPPSPEEATDEDFEEGRPLNFVRSKVCTSYVETCCLAPKSPPRPSTAAHAPQTQKPVCGRRHPDGVGFYYNGQHTADDAKFAEFPWMVALLRDKPDDDDDNPSGKTPATYLGSGSLIHPSVVLTAGHLVSNNWSYKVRAGITSLHENYLGNELYPHQDRNVKNITVNKEFDKNTLIFDVALLFLESPMTMAPNVGVVCLPSQSDYSSARSNCIGSGWGKDKFGKRGKYRTRMKKFNLTLIDHNKCQEQLQQTRLGLFFELHPTFTCADDSSAKDGCQGDGGSPLVCPIAGENMRYQQRGIVSWGIGCGNMGVPTVYVDVARVRAWIDDAVVAEGLDPQVYTP